MTVDKSKEDGQFLWKPCSRHATSPLRQSTAVRRDDVALDLGVATD